MLYAMRVQKKTKLLPIEGLQGTIIIYSASQVCNFLIGVILVSIFMFVRSTYFSHVTYKLSPFKIQISILQADSKKFFQNSEALLIFKYFVKTQGYESKKTPTKIISPHFGGRKHKKNYALHILAKKNCEKFRN